MLRIAHLGSLYGPIHRRRWEQMLLVHFPAITLFVSLSRSLSSIPLSGTGVIVIDVCLFDNTMSLMPIFFFILERSL
jgi:hypothetical protein